MSPLSENFGRNTCLVMTLLRKLEPCTWLDARRLRCVLTQIAELSKLREDACRTFLDRHSTGVDLELGRQWLLVRVANARKLRDLARDGLLVETLDVALDAFLERGGHIDLDEISYERAGLVTSVAKRTDGGDDHRHPIASQEVSDERNARDVGIAVFAAEAEALREVC